MAACDFIEMLNLFSNVKPLKLQPLLPVKWKILYSAFFKYTSILYMKINRTKTSLTLHLASLYEIFKYGIFLFVFVVPLRRTIWFSELI